jgi:hypothetical protein
VPWAPEHRSVVPSSRLRGPNPPLPPFYAFPVFVGRQEKLFPCALPLSVLNIVIVCSSVRTPSTVRIGPD